MIIVFLLFWSNNIIKVHNIDFNLIFHFFFLEGDQYYTNWDFPTKISRGSFYIVFKGSVSRYFILASFLGAQLNLIHKKAKKSGDAATLNNIISAFCIRNRFIFCVSNDIKHGYCNIGYQFWIFVTLFADTLMCIL